MQSPMQCIYVGDEQTSTTTRNHSIQAGAANKMRLHEAEKLTNAEQPPVHHERERAVVDDDKNENDDYLCIKPNKNAGWHATKRNRMLSHERANYRSCFLGCELIVGSS